MAKVILSVACCLVLCISSGEITNLSQIVGRNVDSTVVAELPRRNFSSPETAYLNFIRAMATTSEADWVAGFSSRKIFEYAGSADPDVLNDRSDSPLVEILANYAVSNMVVTSYTMNVVTADIVSISAVIAIGMYTNSFPIVFSKTNNAWVIENFLEDE